MNKNQSGLFLPIIAAGAVILFIISLPVSYVLIFRPAFAQPTAPATNTDPATAFIQARYGNETNNEIIEQLTLQQDLLTAELIMMVAPTSTDTGQIASTSIPLMFTSRIPYCDPMYTSVPCREPNGDVYFVNPITQ